MKTIKGIIEYKKIQKEIIIPPDIIRMNKALNMISLVDDKYLFEEVYGLLLESINQYFENQGCKIFMNSKLYTEGLLIVPKIMRKNGICFYCIMDNDIPNMRIKRNYADGTYRY